MGMGKVVTGTRMFPFLEACMDGPVVFSIYSKSAESREQAPGRSLATSFFKLYFVSSFRVMPIPSFDFCLGKLMFSFFS